MYRCLFSLAHNEKQHAALPFFVGFNGKMFDYQKKPVSCTKWQVCTSAHKKGNDRYVVCYAY